jgi:hypothetical protein
VVHGIIGMELIRGAGFNLEKAESAARVAWISDLVHPSGHTFAKMALEAMAPSGKLAAPSGRKRKRDESASGDGGGIGNRTRARAWSAPGRGTSAPTSRHYATTTGSTDVGNRRGAGVTAACISSHIRVEIISADADPAVV